MPPPSESHLEAANMDIHLIPENALLGACVVFGQKSKAVGSEEQGVTLHWRVHGSQPDTQMSS